MMEDRTQQQQQQQQLLPPLSLEIVRNTTDVKLLRSEIESLNTRLKKLNSENDELLQRLSDSRRQKDSLHRQFEEEKNKLINRIHQLDTRNTATTDSTVEKRSGNGGTTRYDEQQEQLNLLREQLVAERKEHQVNQKVLRLEIDQLKDAVESKTKQISELLTENNNLQQNLIAAEHEQQLKTQLDELRSTVSQETKKRQALIKDHQVEVSELMEGERQWKEKVEELKTMLEREEKRRLEVVRDYQEQQRSFADKEMKYQQEIDDMRTRELELKSQVEQGTLALELKEKMLEQATLERVAVTGAKEEFQTKASYRERQLQTEIENLNTMLSGKDRALDEANWKMRELRAAKEHLERKEDGMKKALDDQRGKHEEAEEKNRKLERAVVRLKLDNDRINAKLKDHSLGVDQHFKNLLKEQQSHISDLQKEVNTLRVALKDFSHGNNPTVEYNPANTVRKQETSRRQSPRRDNLDQQTSRLSKTAARLEMGGEVETRSQLEHARRELDAGNKRIKQLEKWLDEIFSDGEFGVGNIRPRLSELRDGTEKVRGGGSGVSLPEVHNGRNGPNGDRKNYKEQIGLDGKPVWDRRTKLTKVA